MQFKFVSNDFICKAYCKNELHDLKNESNESNEWRLGHSCYKQTSFFVVIFSMLMFGFIRKAATTKIRPFLYDLSMLCFGLDKLE
jgi:hypothetical protein